jgi:hypothetical protein
MCLNHPVLLGELADSFISLIYQRVCRPAPLAMMDVEMLVLSVDLPH